MSRKEIYEVKLQIDYFSDSYLKFEEDFYRYSALGEPLTTLTDDILRAMAMSQNNYFKLSKRHSKDGRDHYFYFTVDFPGTYPRIPDAFLKHRWRRTGTDRWSDSSRLHDLPGK